MGKKTDLSVNRRRKATSGAATAYLTRNQALKKLQLRLADFRRICILKGIYPHEPRHLKKAGGATGSNAPKTYYYAKDINFLLHEPIVTKFREYKIYSRKLKRAQAKSEKSAAKRLRENKPRYNLDAIIRERFPTFIDAVRYLPDCLDMCFAYSTMPVSKRTPFNKVTLCRRLTVEFMLYVITSRSLRKVFVSIKGYYFEAEISGEAVRWRVPHSRAYETPRDVDFRILGTHVELYGPLLGFVNFRLFSMIGLHYPPTLASSQSEKEDDATELEDRVASLNLPLKTNTEVDEVEADVFPSGDDESLERLKADQEAQKKFENLFGGMRFFLQREVDREQLTFVIRSFGGEVSWDRTFGAGCTYQESDERITHQIVDRGAQSPAQKVVNRCYVQPQWVFDCVNSRRLVAAEKYFPGVALPPHLSPFVEEKDGEYVPPEKREIPPEFSAYAEDDVASADESEEKSGGESMEEEEEEVESSESENEKTKLPQAKKSKKPEVPPMSNRQMKKLEKNLKSTLEPAKKPTAVTAGKLERTDAGRSKEQSEREDKKLAEMMIPKKKQRLYRKIMHLKKKTAHEARILSEKRDQHEHKQKKIRKSAA